MSLGPIHHPATYERVVEQIRRVIYLGRFLPGDKLPPERELAQQLNVSRTTVREAIRILESENLIRVKRGATGGIIVVGKGLQSGTERVTILTTEQNKALQAIFEYRIAIERQSSRLAAERRSEKDLRVLETAVARMTTLTRENRNDRFSIAEFNAGDTLFHIALAEASKNHYLVRAIEQIRADMFLPVGSIFERLSKKANEHHTPILDAVRNQDPDGAEALITEHLTAALNGLQEFLPQ